MRLFRFAGYLLLALMVNGCGNGFDCPSTVPSCCYDTLFGCEIFDLPPTCSCSSYGIFRTPARRALPEEPRQTLMRSASSSLSGTWSGILDKQSSTCRAFLPQVNGVISIADTKNKVSVKVLNYGSLHGVKRKNRFIANGSYKPTALLPCSARVSVQFKKVSPGIGKVIASLRYACSTESSCSSRYSGTVQKQ